MNAFSTTFDDNDGFEDFLPIIRTKNIEATTFSPVQREQANSKSAPQIIGISVPPKPLPDLAEIKRAASVLIAKGSKRVVELRALKTAKKTWSGYYNNGSLAQDSYDLSVLEDVPNVYWTLQEINPALLARRANAVKGWADVTTSDEEVLRYLYLPFDFDACRLAGISSSDGEKTLALETATLVRGFLVERGISPILADSGNGYHLLVRIDLQVSRESTALVAAILDGAARKFSTCHCKSQEPPCGKIKIDTSLFNPSRILKAYGSVARKGSHTAERPWRLSKILDAPENMGIVSEKSLLALLKELGGTVSASGTVTTPTSDTWEGATPEIMEATLDNKGLERGPRLAYKNGYKWQLIRCPFNPEHKSPDSFIALERSGLHYFHCSHDSCKENCKGKNGWKKFKEQVGGFEFVAGNVSTNSSSGIDYKADEILEVADVAQFPDMPSDAIVGGALGDICHSYLSNFPLAYAWPAILTVAGTMVPPPGRTVSEVLAVSVGAGSQTNLYTALIGDVGSGKSQAIAHAIGNLGLPRNRYTDTKAGSIEGLLAKLAESEKLTLIRGDTNPGQILVDLDEWSHLFRKANIENASFVDVLNSGFNKPEFHLTIAGGKKIDVNCALSLVGGIVTDKIQDCFGASSIGGFHDRFLFGVCPTVNPFQYYPFDISESAQKDPFLKPLSPVSVKINKSVWALVREWKKADTSLDRSVEVTVRCTSIIASFDGRDEIFDRDLERMRPFLDYQIRCRKLVEPNPGVTVDAKMSNGILQWLKHHADKGDWVNQRALKKGLHHLLDNIGPGAYNNTIKNLVFIRAVETKSKANAGARDSHLIRLVKGM